MTIGVALGAAKTISGLVGGSKKKGKSKKKRGKKKKCCGNEGALAALAAGMIRQQQQMQVQGAYQAGLRNGMMAGRAGMGMAQPGVAGVQARMNVNAGMSSMGGRFGMQASSMSMSSGAMGTSLSASQMSVGYAGPASSASYAMSAWAMG